MTGRSPIATALFGAEDDDPDDDPDEDDEPDGDADDEDEGDEEDEETETWQVSRSLQNDTIPLKAGSRLTSGTVLPRLARSFQSSQGWNRLSRPRVASARFSASARP